MPTDVPTDLIRYTEVLSTFKPSRSWWDARIAAGAITAYTVPGERGIFLSKAAVEAALQPRPYEKPERGAKEA